MMCTDLRGSKARHHFQHELIAAPIGLYFRLKMPFEIVLAPDAVEDLRRLRADVRSSVRTALETHLRHAPERTSRSRIKRLRGVFRPQYRLRVGDVRVFYDVSATTVEVLAIVSKSEAVSWLARRANPK
jgi:mRNA interferase RelE/StbE